MAWEERGAKGTDVLLAAPINRHSNRDTSGFDPKEKSEELPTLESEDLGVPGSPVQGHCQVNLSKALIPPRRWLTSPLLWPGSLSQLLPSH